MTTEPFTSNFELDRRSVLKSAALLGAVGTVGLPAASGSAVASSHGIETLYLTDSGGDNSGSFLGKLYTVDLDDSHTPPRAELPLLTELSDGDFGQVDAIAASLDGTTVFMVDKTSRHLGVYDVDAGTFSDEGQIAGLPGGVVLASHAPDGTLYVLSQDDDTMYTVDVAGPSATPYVAISGANVQGADIAFDATGTLYLYSSGAQTLYTVDYDDASPTFGQATAVGPTGDFFTGLAVRDAGNGDLVGSNTTRDEIVVVDKATGAQGTAYELYLDGARYPYGYGDMTVGALEVCTVCEADGVVAKFEYDDDAAVDTFVLEEGSDASVWFEHYVSKPDEDGEPMTATFGTEYCDLYAVVKSGREIEVQAFEDLGGSLTVETANDERYAISFVAFYCTEAAALEAAESFPSNGRGRGRGA